MDLSTAFRDTAAVFRRCPADLLPFYVLTAAIPAVTRTVSLTGFAAIYAYLSVTGRLARIRTALTERDLPVMPDPEADPEAFGRWATEIGTLLEPLFDPVVGVLLIITFLVAILVAVLLHAGVAAGQYAVCFARLCEEPGTRAGIGGVRSHWFSILALAVIEVAVWIAATLVAAIAVAIAAAIHPILGAVIGLAAFLAWTIIVLGARAVFTFAPVSVIVDDVGALDGVAGAMGFIRSNPAEAIGYYAIAIAALFALASAAGVSSFLGAPSVVGLVSLLLLAPALDLVKTDLLGRWRGAIRPDTVGSAPDRDLSLDRSLLTAARDGLRRGWSEMLEFPRATPGLHAIAIFVAVIGFVTGWVAAEPLTGVVTTSIADRLTGHVPPTAALEFLANNWTVALGTALAGVVLALPAVAALWFNGFIFGIYFRLEADFAELLAFVVPHGILELPALIIAGALGLHLGRSGWRTWRGRASRKALAADLVHAVRVLVGVGLLLFIAGLIEGFFSPYYYRLFL